jgi:hypothetical protein
MVASSSPVGRLAVGSFGRVAAVLNGVARVEECWVTMLGTLLVGGASRRAPLSRWGAARTARALTGKVKVTLTLQYDLPCVVEEPGTPERESDDVVEIFLEFSRVNLIVSV